MTKCFIVAASFAAAITSAACAHAQGRHLEMVTQVISYRDAELATPQGAIAVLQRIEHTASRLCEPRPASPLDRPHREDGQCRLRAIARAVADLNAPLVTAAYTSGSSRSEALFAQR